MEAYLGELRSPKVHKWAGNGVHLDHVISPTNSLWVSLSPEEMPLTLVTTNTYQL
jgi:hypothetical protein